MSDFTFDTLEPQSKIINVGGKPKYVVFEASEGAATKYRNAAARSAVMTDGKVTGVQGIGEIQPLLVSECIYELKDGKVTTLADGVTPDPRSKIPLATVKFWSAKTVKPLFNWIKEVSQLDEPTESPERKALLALFDSAMTQSAVPFATTLDEFRALVDYLTRTNPTIYSPLWKLVEPRESDPNVSPSHTTDTSD